MNRKRSRNGVSNIVPEVKETCRGCFAVQDNYCMALNEIMDDCPFKKGADEDGKLKQI